MPLDPDMLRQLWEANAFRPGTLPQSAFGLGPSDDISILKGQSAFGRGAPLPQANPLSNYPQARQPGEGMREFIDRSGQGVPGALATAAQLSLPAGPMAFSVGM